MEDKNAGEREIIFRRGVVVCKYNGEVISYDEGGRRYGLNTGPYLIAHTNNGIREDAALVRGVGSIINHKRQSSSNVDFTLRSGSIYIVANKNIRNHSETYVNYGNYYIMDANEYATNGRKLAF